MKKIGLLILSLLMLGCSRHTEIKEAKSMSDRLLKSIELGNAEIYFPEKYFSKTETIRILQYLKDYCDFKNRKGTFINDFYSIQDGEFRVAFLYEYYLKCDSLRFILTYRVNPVELMKFKIEPIEKEIFMITSPKKRLVN